MSRLGLSWSSLRHALFDSRVQGAAWLSVASLISAAVAIIAVPMLTSLYSPDDFGALALMSAIAATIGTIVSGRYEMVCIVAPHDEDGNATARQAASVASWLSAAAGALFTAISLVLLLGFSGLGKPAIVLLGIPLLIALTGVAAAQSLFDTRLGNYGLLALLTVARSVGVVVGQIIWGHLNPSLAALIVPFLAFSALPLFRLAWLLRRYPKHNRMSTREFLRRYRTYPIYQVPAALANSLSSNITVFALGGAYGVASVGIYSIATRITTAPAAIVAGPVNTVYFREAARLSTDKRKSLRMYGGVVLGLLIVGVVGFLALALLAKPIVGLLGSDWVSATGMIYATLTMGLALFITAPANSALIAYGQQAQLLVWRVGLVIAPPILILLGPRLGWSDAVAVAAASLALLVGTGGYLWYGLTIVRRGNIQAITPPSAKLDTSG